MSQGIAPTAEPPPSRGWWGVLPDATAARVLRWAAALAVAASLLPFRAGEQAATLATLMLAGLTYVCAFAVELRGRIRVLESQVARLANPDPPA